MADLPSSLEIARRRLGGLPYVGSEPSVALLTEADLGELAALAWHPRQDAADPWVVAGRWSFIDARDQPSEPAREGVYSWHPLQPDADADAWRRLVVARRLEQPFSQVFRETYSAASLSRFSVPELDLHSLLGLARARGWVLRRGGRLVRRLGKYRVELDVGDAFPGAVGITRCYAVEFFRGAEGDAVEPSQLEPQGLSKCLREVDLLVSVAASAVDPALADESASVRSRRAALVRMLGETPDPSQPYVAGRYVRSGDLAIHIATGRVSERGAEREFTVESTKGGVLPYPDKILERIVTALDQQRRGQV